MNRSSPSLAAVLLSLPLLACGGGSKVSTGGGVLGPPTGTVIADCTGPLAVLTYDSFAKGFFGTGGANPGFCTGCHETAKTGANRLGAPSDHNFETLTLLRGDPDMLGHIDRVAGARPGASGVVNTIMPPNTTPGGTPTLLDRQKLSCWIATGAN
jgi:hypothetical protein